MKQKTQLFGLTLTMVGVAGLVALPAFAGPYAPRASAGGAVSRSTSTGSTANRVTATRGVRNLSGGSSISRGPSGNPSISRAPGISGGSPSRGSGYGGSNRSSPGDSGAGDVLRSLGEAIGQRVRDRDYADGRYDHPFGSRDRRGDDAMAKAYRDVGIANAVVNLVGVMVQASQANPYCQPQGQWVRDRVMVAPARYETRQVWIPEMFDPYTGRKTGGGYYETRTEYVPAVYEERSVLVTSTPVRY